MHKQLKHTPMRAGRKSVLLFVLLFSLVLMGISVYLFATGNKNPEQEFANTPQHLLQNNNSLYGLTCSGVIAALLLISGVCMALLSEVSKRKKKIDELVRQKDFYLTTINSIAEGLITTGKNGEVVYMNPAAEKLTGWSSTEAKDYPVEKVHKVVNEGSGRPLQHIASRILNSGREVRFENNILLNIKSQRRQRIVSGGSPLLDAAGNISGAVLLFHDISEKKENEKQLKDSEAFSRGIVDALNSRIAVINQAGTIVKVNAAWSAYARHNHTGALRQYEEGANYFAICKTFGNAADAPVSKRSRGLKKFLRAAWPNFIWNIPYLLRQKKDGPICGW